MYTIKKAQLANTCTHCPLQETHAWMVYVYNLDYCSVAAKMLSYADLCDANPVNWKEHLNATPLHAACKNGHLKVVEKLIEKGADIKAKWVVCVVHILYILDIAQCIKCAVFSCMSAHVQINIRNSIRKNNNA